MRAQRQKKLGLIRLLWLVLAGLVMLVAAFVVFFVGCGEGGPAP